MSDTALLKIRRRFSDAYRARDYASCTQLAAQGLQLAEAKQDVASQTLMLVWLGESHWQRKEIEPAVAALSRAAAAEPPADPADIFNALSTLVTIALLERPLASVQTLIAQGRAHLERHQQQRSRHMLDLSEGDLAARRGDWSGALQHYQSAYQHQQGETGSPRFTLVSYQIKLAEASFMLGDAEALGRWCAEINSAPKQVEGDRLRAEQARLLGYRAGLREPAGARGGPLATARRVLCWLEEIDGHQAEFARDAMQVLLREGDWLSVETWLDYPGIGENPWLRGDLPLARARQLLQLPARDPDWASATPSDAQADAPQVPRATAESAAKARQHLQAAQDRFEEVQAWAKSEDQRLETDYHQCRTAARLHQVETLIRRLDSC
jgi:hypothetical protein